MLRFEQSGKIFSVVNEQDDDVAFLHNHNGRTPWQFEAEENVPFTAAELRQIADELDRLNGGTKG